MQKNTRKISPKKVVPSKKTAVHTAQKTNKSIRLPVMWIANIVAFIAVICVNYLAVSLPIGGMTTGQLSDLYPNLFTPAGITFSIRGLIYLAILWFVIWQVIDLFNKKSHWITKKIGIRFLLSCVTNIGWIFARHFQQVFLSVIIMLAFLIVLIILGNKVKLWQKLWTRKEKLLVQVPFSLYLWRISVAIIANISAWLVHIGWTMRGMTPIFWTIFMIIVATLLALLQLYKKQDIVFALVVIRAFIGIIIKTLWAEIIYTNIIWTLGIGIVAIATAIGRNFEQWRKN